ncbi:hypothetical protein CC86DRAFT_375651 [Ophiobolus disseminans]|uniref:Reverse transcriptase domain-containing protein n=1 Tax=Ophiobolus disseminans TaxID=1469910 RepID=A0A6A6ZE79_9PLEO|nr:hypothetical protein CC86DRAFT_375651 [Ophiobolus disseminans]
MFNNYVITRALIILEKQTPLTINDKPLDKALEGKATLKAISEVNLKIMRTVARLKLHLITKLDLDITSQQQVLELSTLYTNLNEYSRITSLCKAEDIAEIKVMIGCEENVKDPLTLEGLINCYRYFFYSILKCYTLNPKGRLEGFKLSQIGIRNCLHAFKNSKTFNVSKASAVAALTSNTLIDRWIVNPRSNVKTADAKPANVRKVIVNVKRSSVRKDILLTHVVYVLGFLTNLFALRRCRRLGIYFNLGRNILYKDKAIKHLRDSTTSLNGKMKKDISRRPRANKACRLFYRIIALHAVCEYTKLYKISITRLVNKIKHVGYRRADADLGSSAKEVLTLASIKVEVRSLDTPAQLGGAERARALIVIVARVLRIYASLPKTLANKLRTLHEIVTSIRLDLSRLYAIGSRGFVLNKHLLRGDKLKERTFKATNRVIRVRNVRFIDELYKNKLSTLPASSYVIKTAHISKKEHYSDTIVVAQLMQQRQTTTSSPLQKQVQQLPILITTARSTPALFKIHTRSPSSNLNFNNATNKDNTVRDNIITSRRRRYAHFIKASPLTKYYAFAATIAQAHKATTLALQSRIKHNSTRIYRDNLPPLLHITALYIDNAFNKDSYLLKHKARLIVPLIALVCAFNLKAMQYDMLNAFLNAPLDRTLHESLRRVILFFYVDDIIILYYLDY